MEGPHLRLQKQLRVSKLAKKSLYWVEIKPIMIGIGTERVNCDVRQIKYTKQGRAENVREAGADISKRAFW